MRLPPTSIAGGKPARASLGVAYQRRLRCVRVVFGERTEVKITFFDKYTIYARFLVRAVSIEALYRAVSPYARKRKFPLIAIL